MDGYVRGILSPGFGTTFRYIDFHDENNEIEKVMKILIFSYLANFYDSEAVASQTSARPK